MPREVFAEEIERFLGTLEGVAAVRVFPNVEGEISHVYVTAEPAADARAVRRGVEAALVSKFAILIDPWRIQVTRPRSGLRVGELPRFRVLRVEEAMTASELTATVQLGWQRDGEDRVASGRARGLVGGAHRLRALASAAVEAAREALDPEHRRMTVLQASLVTFLDTPTVLVGVSIATLRGPEISLGIARDDGSPEAVVAAALDAVLKWMLRTAFAESAPPPGDRRAWLDAVRRHVHSGEGGAAAPGPLPARHGAPPAHRGEPGREAQHGSKTGARPAVGGVTGTIDEPEGHAEAWPESDEALPEESAGDEWLGAGAAQSAVAGATVSAEPAMHPGESNGRPDPDIVWDLREIRPETKGVIHMATQHQPSGSPEPNRAPGHASRPSMEDAFYQSLIAERTPVHLRCRDGYELPRAVLREAGTYSLLLETEGGAELVYKHAIVSIRPLPDRSTQA